MMDRVKDQHSLTYDVLRLSASPDTSVNMLQNADRRRPFRCILIISYSKSEALLLVLNLPLRSLDRVYQVWLNKEVYVKEVYRDDGGLLTVDSTGFTQAVIMPVIRFAELEAVPAPLEPAASLATCKSLV